jgi:predicted ATPase
MPEENLDNKFICDELKDAIRQAKKKRQIILATNNANLVINTDAEEVIVADYKDNVISYTIGSIEDKSIRDEITHILEGGREALIKREQKYGFQ